MTVFNIVNICWCFFPTGSPLVASLLRLLYFDHENQQGVHQETDDGVTDRKTDGKRDVQLLVLTEMAAELLSTLLTDLPMVRCSECRVRLQTSDQQKVICYKS